MTLNNHESISSFLFNLSHEIRTPLHAIIGMAEVLKHSKTEKEIEENVKLIKGSSETLLDILKEIDELCKIEMGETQLDPQLFSIDEMLHSIQLDFQAKAQQKNLSFRIDRDVSLPPYLIGDVAKLKIVISKLLSRALAHTHNGRVSVALSQEKFEGDTIWVRLAVEDTGMGLRMKESSSLYKRDESDQSRSNRQAQQGKLGMTLAQKLVELQGGNLAFQNFLGRGSSYYCSLPFTLSPDHSSGSQKHVPIDYHQLSKLNVLLVEDVKTNQVMMQKLFDRHSIRASYTENGIEALRVLKDQLFDVILMDLHMPVMDGKQATKLIRKPGTDILDHQVPIIGLTADASEKTREEMLQLGMNDYLTKPVNIEELYRKLLKCASQDQGENC